MRRKILVFTSTWNQHVFAEIMEGVTEYLGPESEIHIFNAYDESIENTFYQKEREIFELPCVDDYDGVMLVMNSVGAVRWKGRELDLCKASGKPVVSVDQHFDGIPFCGLDNYQSMYSLTAHLIVKHGCSVINYVGGMQDHEEDIMRVKAVKDCMNDYCLELAPNREVHYNFLFDDGAKAFHYYEEHGLLDMDAVICANDYMAIGFIGEAKRYGHSVPRDFIVTGFDNLEQGQGHIPSITSVNRNWKQLGFDSMSVLDRMIDGREVPDANYTTGVVKTNESCGCLFGKRDLEEDYFNLYQNKITRGTTYVAQGQARQALCSCSCMDDFMCAMETSRKTLAIDDFAVVLNDSFFDDDNAPDKVGYDADLRTFLGSGEGAITRSTTLIPTKFKDSGTNIYLFGALHFENQTYGYCVKPYEPEFFASGEHRVLLESLSLALQNIRQRLALDSMNNRLRKLYIQDSLTGLLNRFGYNSKAEKFFEMHKGNLFLVYFDVDNLKQLNDYYGHAMGDIAIKGAAQAIEEAFPDPCIKIRMGGDEFLVIGEFDSEADIIRRENRVSNYLENYSMVNKMPMLLEISMGHVWNQQNNPVSLETLVSRADQQMYAIKQEKKSRHS